MKGLHGSNPPLSAAQSIRTASSVIQRRPETPARLCHRIGIQGIDKGGVVLDIKSLGVGELYNVSQARVVAFFGKLQLTRRSGEGVYGLVNSLDGSLKLQIGAFQFQPDADLKVFDRIINGIPSGFDLIDLVRCVKTACKFVASRI
jgi:hypothetical protein